MAIVNMTVREMVIAFVKKLNYYSKILSYYLNYKKLMYQIYTTSGSAIEVIIKKQLKSHLLY